MTKLMDIPAIAHDLNAHAKNYKIGKLQKIRKHLKNKKRLAGVHIFGNQTMRKDWAFHNGGRSELQFNIGNENIDGRECLRFGVAFSLEPSRTLPDISVLFPKVKRFNEFLHLYPEDFGGFYTWYWEKERTPIFSENQIRTTYTKRGVFAFFGKYIDAEQYSADTVLKTFDQLLPLYEYVEGPDNVEPLQDTDKKPFVFKGNPFHRIDSTSFTESERIVDVHIRHVAIQSALLARLEPEYGVENVIAEISSGIGNKVDVMVRFGSEFWFYEVKTNGTARMCIREALGQLLEYSYWPAAQNATKLIVVGEPPFDADASRYISELRSRFSIPIAYEQQEMKEI